MAAPAPQPLSRTSDDRPGTQRVDIDGFADELDDQIAAMKALQSDSGLSTSERVNVANAIARLLSIKGSEAKRIEAMAKKVEMMRADVEREYEDLAVREAPFVRRLLDHIIEALRDHPDALRDVSEAVDIAMRSSDGS